MSNVLVEPQIVSRDRMQLAGLRYEGRNEHGEIPAMWETFFSRLVELRERCGDPNVFYGVSRSIAGVPESDGFEYLAGVEVASLDRLPDDMVAWEIPALTYAVLEAHDVAGIMPTCDLFYREWLPHSTAYSAGEPLMIERYPERFPDDQIIELYFPVTPKAAAT